MKPSAAKNIEDIIVEQKSLSALSLEVEKILRFYAEHPNYPLDIDKLRQRVMEVYARINQSITDLQSIQKIFENGNRSS